MRRPTFVRSVVVTAAAALLAAGCGSGASSASNKDPKAAFATGMNGLNDKDALTVTLKFETTPEALAGFAKESGDILNPAVAKDIASGEIVFETKTTNGKNLSEVKPGDANATASRFAFNDNGTQYAEFLSRDSALYARADVKGLLALFGKSKTYAELRARARTLPPFVKAFVANQWITLPTSVLTALASQFGGASAMPNADQMKKLVAALKDVINRDVTVTRIGSDDQGDHLRLTTQSRQLVGDLVQSLGGAIPAASLLLGKFDPSKVADHSIVLDAWVKDGALAKLSLDVVQFAKPGEAKAGDSLPVVLTFDRSGDDVSKPDGATPVDLTQLGSLLGGLGA